MRDKYQSLIYVLKGIGIAAIALILKAIVSFAIFLFYSTENMFGDFPNFAVYIVCFVASVFVYNSVIGIFLTFDQISAEEFILHSQEKTGYNRVFGYKGFLLEAISLIVFLSLAAALGASKEIAGMFYTGDGGIPHSTGIIPMLGTAILSSAITFFARYEASRYWSSLKRQGLLEENITKKRLIIRLAIVFVAYPIAYPFLPLLAFVAFTLFRIAISGIKILLVIKKRKKLIFMLSTVVREHGFELSQIQDPYSSLFNVKKQCSFTVKNKKTTYNCLIIGHLFRSVPICFTSDSEGFFRYRLGTKRHNITMQKHFAFSLDGEGIKIMIINPTPKHAYILDVDTEKEKRLFNADKLWNYVVYEADAFIGALDRDCLGKYSSVAENNDVKVPRIPNVHL